MTPHSKESNGQNFSPFRPGRFLNRNLLALRSRFATPSKTRRIAKWLLVACCSLFLFPKSSWASTAAAAASRHEQELILLAAYRPIPVVLELILLPRLVFATLMGALVGWERSASKQPHAAGVRTMALVCLGAAVFSICSIFGFAQCSARVDPSRMAANVASGVGFLGAGVITTTHRQVTASRLDSKTSGDTSAKKGKENENEDGQTWDHFDGTAHPNENGVHGLTTAAAIWLSAAQGIAAGVGLYMTSALTTLCTILILRLGRVKKHVQRNEQRQHIRLFGYLQKQWKQTYDQPSYQESFAENDSSSLPFFLKATSNKITLEEPVQKRRRGGKEYQEKKVNNDTLAEDGPNEFTKAGEPSPTIVNREGISAANETQLSSEIMLELKRQHEEDKEEEGEKEERKLVTKEEQGEQELQDPSHLNP